MIDDRRCGRPVLASGCDLSVLYTSAGVDAQLGVWRIAAPSVLILRCYVMSVSLSVTVCRRLFIL